MQLILLMVTIGPTDCIAQALFKNTLSIHAINCIKILKYSSNHNPSETLQGSFVKKQPTHHDIREVAGVTVVFKS
jgi:hypothetical protein